MSSHKLIFMGTPEFGAIILERLAKSKFKPILVVTASDKPVGRKRTLTPPPVKIIAERYEIPVFQTEKILDLEFEIKKLKPDLIVVGSYRQILPEEILKIPKYGCLNIHPSLLPRYRGPSPIQSAILSGDEKTGVTIIQMTEKLDAGPILIQRELEIKNQKFQELHNELAELGAELLIEILPKLLTGKITPQPQNGTKATYTKIFTKEDGKIDWRKPAKEIERQIRALNPEPGVFTTYKNKILKILEVDFLSNETDKKVGEVFLTKDKKMAVQCGQNCLILLKLQLEGKKPVLAEDFLRGYPEIIGKIFQ